MHHHHERGGGFGRGPGRHRERGLREGRVFDHGDLRWVVLALIAEAPRHGYEIIRAVEEKVGGAYSPSPGVVYPTLTLLEETGLASVTATEGSKKLYAITPEGQAQLVANRPGVEALFERMSHIRERSAGGLPPPVLRAMENLRTAMRLKLERGPLDDQQAQLVAEALDAAAVAIERA